MLSWVARIRRESLFKMTAPGFSDEQRERALQPFFTTKKGTGLGMPICKRIIDQHGGQIAIEPSGNAGATITISLKTNELKCQSKREQVVHGA